MEVYQARSFSTPAAASAHASRLACYQLAVGRRVEILIVFARSRAKPYTMRGETRHGRAGRAKGAAVGMGNPGRPTNTRGIRWHRFSRAIMRAASLAFSRLIGEPANAGWLSDGMVCRRRNVAGSLACHAGQTDPSSRLDDSRLVVVGLGERRHAQGVAYNGDGTRKGNGARGDARQRQRRETMTRLILAVVFAALAIACYGAAYAGWVARAEALAVERIMQQAREHPPTPRAIPSVNDHSMQLARYDR